MNIDDPRFAGYREAQGKYFSGDGLKPGYISSQFALGGYGKPLYELKPSYSKRWVNNPGRGTSGYANELTKPGLYIYKDPNYRAPAAPAAPAVPTAPSAPPPTPFDKRLESIKSDNSAQVSKLMEQIKAQQSQYESSMKRMQDMFNTQIGQFKSSYDNQISTLNKTIDSYQKSYNPTTAVGTTAKATSFEVPESTAGQLGIKNKGTSQFNRKVRNNLKITGVQL